MPLADGPRVDIDVLVPTCDRPHALAVTLASLLGQTFRSFRVVVSDQGEVEAASVPEVRAVLGVLASTGRPVELHRHLPRRGLAEHRGSLLERVTAPRALFLDDDVLCEPDLLERMRTALLEQGCGFVGSFVNAPSAVDSEATVDQPPEGLDLELWDGPVHPELVGPGLPAWSRRHLHFASFVHRLGRRRGIEAGDGRLYKVAWVGGCVLYDTEALRSAGGFSFWEDLPPDHCGEDVLAQLRVMARAGGAALVPSGAWHQEVPTTVRRRDADAPYLLPVVPAAS